MAAIKHTQIMGHKLRMLSGVGPPVDGAVGTGTHAGKAEPGTLYVDTTSGLARVFRNEGTKASPVWSITGRIQVIHSLGRNGAGNLALVGAKVGDRVAGVYNISTPGNLIASFEAVITLVDAIQQSSASNLSAVNCLFFIQR